MTCENRSRERKDARWEERGKRAKVRCADWLSRQRSADVAVDGWSKAIKLDAVGKRYHLSSQAFMMDYAFGFGFFSILRHFICHFPSTPST
jgi:hypothetical protein